MITLLSNLLTGSTFDVTKFCRTLLPMGFKDRISFSNSILCLPKLFFPEKLL